MVSVQWLVWEHVRVHGHGHLAVPLQSVAECGSLRVNLTKYFLEPSVFNLLSGAVAMDLFIFFLFSPFTTIGFTLNLGFKAVWNLVGSISNASCSGHLLL
jgi:hypothetical protein